MSTIQSSAEHLTLNADGTSKDIKFQANGVEKASISSAGAFTSTTIDATKLTGTIPNFTSTGIDDNADATAITIDSSERVGIKTTSPQSYHSGADDLVVYASGSSGITIATGDTTSSVALKFADGTDVTSENAGYIDYAHSDNSMRFGTTATERMRIDSSGDVFVGTTSSFANSSTRLEVISESAGLDCLACKVLGTNQNAISFYQNGYSSPRGSITVGTSSVAYNTSSDYRLKENVDYTWDATTRLKQLKPARFNFIADDTNTLVDGFIAHEVSSVVPEAVSGEKDAMIAEVLYTEGDDIPEGKSVGDVKTAAAIDPQGIDQSKLVPLLVKTIQELEARITELENA